MNELPWLIYLWKKAGFKHFVYICALTPNIRNYDGNQGRLEAFNFSQYTSMISQNHLPSQIQDYLSVYLHGQGIICNSTVMKYELFKWTENAKRKNLQDSEHAEHMWLDYPPQKISVHLNLQGLKWYNLLHSIILMWDFLQTVPEK